MSAISSFASAKPGPQSLGRAACRRSGSCCASGRPLGLQERGCGLCGRAAARPRRVGDAFDCNGHAVLYRHHQAALRERSWLPRCRQDRRAPRQHRRSDHDRHDARPARRHGLSALAQSAEAELKAAQSSLKQAEADEGRYAALNKKTWVSDASYDQKKAAADEARGRVERSARALSLAKNQLAYTDLVTTEAGIITALPVEVGQVVSAGQLIVRVARLDELEAVVSIPESRIDAAQKAMATVTLWADDSRTYDAKLSEVSPQADPATRTYQARYSLPKPDPPYTLGKTATVHLASQSAGMRATLPLAHYVQGSGPALGVAHR